MKAVARSEWAPVSAQAWPWGRHDGCCEAIHFDACWWCSACCSGRYSRGQHKILQRMWQAYRAQRQILSGMRKAPGVAPPPTMSGLEWVVEAFGCSSSSLRDTAVLEDLFNNIIREMKLRPVGETQWHQFPGTGGITGLCLLAQS